VTSIHSVFIVTKPLQLIICEIISEQLDLDQKTLILRIDAFKDAKAVAQRISKHGFWTEMRVVETKRDEVREVLKIRPNELFVIGDVGIRAFFTLLKYKMFINKPLWVYEEGRANYGFEWYPNGFKKSIFKRMGIGVHNGGCRFTNGLFVFKPEKISDELLNRRNNFIVQKINPPFQDYCISNFERLCFYFDIPEKLIPKNKSGEVLNLYLSYWLVEDPQQFPYAMAIDFAKKPLKGLKILKSHPHIKNNDALNIPGFDVVLDGSIPIELILIKMAAISNKIIVWHHGSSVDLYIKFPNVEFRRLRGTS
jgi:hypothetical protein